MELAHEMVFQPSANHLPPVVEVFGTNEAHHRIHQERMVMARQPVAARLQGELVDALVAVAGKLRALPGLEVEHVGTEIGATGPHHFLSIGKHLGVDAERAASGLGAGDALEHEVAARPLGDGLHLGCDMGQHANLSRHPQGVVNVLGHSVHAAAHRTDGVVSRVEPYHRVAHPVGQSFADRGEDPGKIVGRMVGLQARRKRPRRADGSPAGGAHHDAGSGAHQIHVGHEPRHAGDGFAREPAP